METEIINATNRITEEKQLNKRQIYEHLLAAGVVKPSSEQSVYEIIERALEEGHIQKKRIIIYRKKSGKLPETFSNEQLISIFENINRPKLAIPVWLGFFCGLRINEICKLRVADVDLQNKRIFVRNSKNKFRSRQGYGKDRIVTIPDIAISSLKKWMDIIQGGTWLLPSMLSPDAPLRSKTVHEEYRQLLNQCCLSEPEQTTNYVGKNHGKKKELKKNTYKHRFHTLRHTYATYLLEKGVPLENIQRSLGHEQIDTTLIYAKVRDTKTEEFINDAFSGATRIVRRETPAPPVQRSEALDLSAEEILRRRLARGEVDLIMYKHLLAQLNPENTINVVHQYK